MANVRVLLDVDGVLNALAPDGGWPEWRTAIGRSWEGNIYLTWAPPVAEFIHSLHASGVEVMWLTMWGASANGDVSDLLGLPQFPIAGTVHDPHEPTPWWKLQVAAQLYANDHKPFAWIDDQLRHCPDALEWARTLPAADWLLVSPQSVNGLEQGHLAAIAEFVALHSRATDEQPAAT